MSDGSEGTATIQRLIGVYNAEGTLRGEVTYWVGARLGRAHCALCDITHGRVKERSDWQACRDGLPVPFETFHLDDQPEDVRSLVAGHAPAVLADTDQGLAMLLDAAALEACDASPTLLVEALTAAADAAALRWPVPTQDPSAGHGERPVSRPGPHQQGDARSA